MIAPLRFIIRHSLAVWVAWALASPARAVDAPSTQATHRGAVVSLKGSKGSFDAYLVKPRGKGPYPAIVVIQEWWGLNDQIKGVADRLSAEGYVAIAPDLYHGKVTSDPEKAHELLRGLDSTEALSNLGAGIDYLKRLPEVGKGKLGSIGFCMGGGLSLQLNLSRSDLAGVVMFYGQPETDPAKLKNSAGALLGFFGEQDEGIPRERVETMAKALRDAGKEAEIHFYPGAGHAFFNETRPSYVPGAATDAWERTLAFFQAKLKR